MENKVLIGLNNQNVLFNTVLKTFEWYLCSKYEESNCNSKFSCQTYQTDFGWFDLYRVNVRSRKL